MSYSVQYCCQGVKPKCVQGKWLDAMIDTKEHVLTIQEYGRTLTSCSETVNIQLPADFPNRLIGKPICVAKQDELYIVQYITKQCRFIKFMMVDAERKTVQCFEDRERYLNKDITTVFPVECLLSPDKGKLICRLPQLVMSNRKWSKMLAANIVRRADEAGAPGSGKYIIEDLKADGLTDRRNQAVAFDPRHRKRLTHVLVDEYCYVCRIAVNCLDDRKELLWRKQRLVSWWIQTGSDPSDTETSSSDEEEHHQLLDCTADYSQSGHALVLCCLTQTSDQYTSTLRLFIFDADTLHLVKSFGETLSKLGVAIYLVRTQLFVPVFSPCDGYVSVWIIEKLRQPQDLRYAIRLPRCHVPTLQAACRTVLLQNCSTEDLSQLRLPQKLLTYIQYRHIHT